MEPCFGLETHISITHSHGFDGFGHWDRLCERHPPLDFWGRDERVDHCWSSWQVTRSGHPIKIPYIVQRGFGNMHLDHWISPDELVQQIKSEHDKERMLLEMICDQEKAATKAKGVFEVNSILFLKIPQCIALYLIFSCFLLIAGQAQRARLPSA